MKYCKCSPKPKPNSDFATDNSRPDGLANQCLECNKKRCAEWYARNQARKLAYVEEYRRVHGRSPEKPERERREIRAKQEEEQKADEPDDFQLIRFSQRQWMFCLLQAQELGIDAQQFVRLLVDDARDWEERGQRLTEKRRALREAKA